MSSFWSMKVGYWTKNVKNSHFQNGGFAQNFRKFANFEGFIVYTTLELLKLRLHTIRRQTIHYTFQKIDNISLHLSYSMALATFGKACNSQKKFRKVMKWVKKALWRQKQATSQSQKSDVRWAKKNFSYKILIGKTKRFF